MTKEELELIANALQSSKENFEREADLFDKKQERPAMVAYLRNELIPKLDEAYKIVKIKYYTARGQ